MGFEKIPGTGKKKILYVAVISILLIVLSLSFVQRGKQLSELQVIACNVAHEEGTCDSRLTDIGIILTEDCCKQLGKCCGFG